MKKCDDCECPAVCARWVEANRTAIPADPTECGVLIAAAVAARENDPYLTDRDYPRAADFADGRNPYERANPDAPWVWRALPDRSGAGGEMVFDGHELTSHDFPSPDLSTSVHQRRFVSVARPERVA